LVLGGRCNILVDCQIGKKSFDLGCGTKWILAGMHLVALGEPDDPIDVGALSVDRIVVNTEELTHLIQQFGPLTSGGGGHSIFLQSRQAFELIIGMGRNSP
jgi:hypothetical protein